ncbi:MAG: tyrosinase family protein [Planctomycetota bacterium]
MWTSEAIGGNGVLSKGWAVANGPFANWPLAHNGGSQPGVLQRQLGMFVGRLPSEQAREQMMAQSVYDAEPWDENRDVESLRSILEGWFVASDGSRLHNQVHVWVGGSMLPGTSPNDPVFFMHHCMVDKLWADWQLAQKATNPDLAASYAPHTGGPVGHNLDDPMFPWVEAGNLVTPMQMLDHHALGFQYDNELKLATEESVVARTEPATRRAATTAPECQYD